jgi:hypothetical protein
MFQFRVALFTFANHPQCLGDTVVLAPDAKKAISLGTPIIRRDLIRRHVISANLATEVRVVEVRQSAFVMA